MLSEKTPLCGRRMTRLVKVLIEHLQTKIEGKKPMNDEDTRKRSVLEELRQQFCEADGACRLKRTLAWDTPQLGPILELLDALLALWLI